MMRGASHCGVTTSCAVLASVSSGSGAVSLCGSSGVSQGASLRVVPFVRRVVGAFARLMVVGALLGFVAVGAGGIAFVLWVFALFGLVLLAVSVLLVSVLVPVSASLLPALSSPALPFVSPVLSCGVVSCPVSPMAMVWSAAACSWMARLARSMSLLARASACASAVMRSACSRASLMMRSASLRASAMMVSACSRACWSAFSRAAVIPSSGFVVSVLLLIVVFSFVRCSAVRCGCAATGACVCVSGGGAVDL